MFAAWTISGSSSSPHVPSSAPSPPCNVRPPRLDRPEQRPQRRGQPGQPLLKPLTGLSFLLTLSLHRC